MRTVVLFVVAACSFQHGMIAGREDASMAALDTAQPDALRAIDARPPDAALPATSIFTADNDTLALFELNGSLEDTSGNGRNAIGIGGTFVTTSWGMGYSLPGSTTQGFQWNAYASLLVHPYSVEIVVTPQSVACWKKLFGPGDALDAGWYYCTSFQSYPSSPSGPGLAGNQRHYLAIVSLSATSIRIYINGTSIGMSNNFTTPPGEAIFFRDDINTNRTEQVTGVVDAVRISKVARTATAILAVQARLATQP